MMLINIDLNMEYVTCDLMHKMLKKEEKEVHGNDTTMLLRQGKVDNFAKTCYYYDKYGHIARFCYKAKNMEQENVNNTKEDDDYIFTIQHEA